MVVDYGPALLVRLLGPVQAWQGDHELELGGPQRQALLGLLATRANRVVSRGELIDGLWGEDPPSSVVNALHVHMTRLRGGHSSRTGRAGRRGRSCSPPGRGIRCDWGPGQLDADVFGRHLAAARVSRAEGDLGNAEQSLATV